MNNSSTPHHKRRLSQPSAPVRVMVVVSLLVVTGCSHSITDAPATSTVSFGYDGPVSGTFQAQGVPRLDLPPLAQTYAYGLKFTNPSTIGVRASRIHSDIWVDNIDMTVPQQAVGDYAVDEVNCPRFNEDRCSGVSVAFDLRNDGMSSQAHFSCMLENGTIRIRTLSSARVTGEFSGVGHCFTDQAVEVDGFHIVNGQFDVSLSAGYRL